MPVVRLRADLPSSPVFDPDGIQEWVSQIGFHGSQVCLVVCAPTFADRAQVYEMAGDTPVLRVALDKGRQVYRWDVPIVDNLTSRVDWGALLVRLLGKVGGSALPEDCRYLGDVFEDCSVETLEALSRWVQGHQTEEDSFLLSARDFPQGSPFDRLQAMLAWLSLASRADVIDRVIFPLDGLEGAPQVRASELIQVVDQLELWAAEGCPLGLVIGTRQEPLDFLGMSPLGQKLQESLLYPAVPPETQTLRKAP